MSRWNDDLDELPEFTKRSSRRVTRHSSIQASLDDWADECLATYGFTCRGDCCGSESNSQADAL